MPATSDSANPPHPRCHTGATETRRFDSPAPPGPALPGEPRDRLRRHRHEPALRHARMFLWRARRPAHAANVLGVLSLILWSLLLIISVKYLILILRADNRGEGGILALATLVSEVVRRGKFVLSSRAFRRGAALRRWDDHAGDLGSRRGRRIACRDAALRPLCRCHLRSRF